MNKKCNKCGNVFPNTEEYFSTYIVRGKKGLRNICKVCRKQLDHNYYKDNFEKISAVNKTYVEKHKEKVKQYKDEWYRKNRDNILKRVCEHRKNNHEYVLKLKKQYRIRNKEKIKVQQRNFYINNKERRIQSTKHRRTKIKKLEANYTIKQWEACKIHFKNKCCYCGKEANLTQDHFIAVNNGGEYTLNNIVPACKSCNSSKQDKDFFHWYLNQEFYSKTREKTILNYLGYKENKTQQLALL